MQKVAGMAILYQEVWFFGDEHTSPGSIRIGWWDIIQEHWIILLWYPIIHFLPQVMIHYPIIFQYPWVSCRFSIEHIKDHWKIHRKPVGFSPSIGGYQFELDDGTLSIGIPGIDFVQNPMVVSGVQIFPTKITNPLKVQKLQLEKGWRFPM